MSKGESKGCEGSGKPETGLSEVSEYSCRSRTHPGATCELCTAGAFPASNRCIPPEHWAMSDSEGDSYHEEGFPSLQCDQEDDSGSVESLPDLVLSAATTLSQTTQVETLI